MTHDRPEPGRRTPRRPAPDPRSIFVAAPDDDAVAGAASRSGAGAGAAVGAAEHAPADPSPGGRRRRPSRRVVLRVVGGVVLAAVLLSVLYTFLLWRAFHAIDRMHVTALSPGSSGGTNYLIIGSDSRDGVPDDEPNADVIFGGDLGPERSDTMVVLRRTDHGAVMLPIPRDLYVDIADTGHKERINTAIQGGPDRLVRTIQQSLGIPIHHVIKVNFASFLSLVDAVGGVPIDFDAPATDPKSGLDIPTAGVHRLNRDQALAYVRSRTYTRVINGKQVVDGRADLGRIERQQSFLRALMHEVGATRNPITLLSVARGLDKGLQIDDHIGFRSALSFARSLRGIEPETLTLPTTPTVTSGGADVLLLQSAAAAPILAQLRD